ncbi:DUF5723 family protein [Tamlana sp. 2_MG-2023]|uniref:DUF5723 family protein n=1 Tax=unclassified Tamlana TaxID=2614803 RepID=UPI0026E3C730|nr:MULTISPECIES: DUF5723 family protein [unclassified Tamlana]MDO6760119.1 DUF5723 family protein [Tamlana sp. 2_MG-2023]MDO6790183.1 DUF5723 family protein [Tamlana sp. 1_MG-2023]
MKKITLLLLVVVSPLWMQGQSFNGFLTDNYSGVNSVIANPANITDSRFKTDINLVGVSAFLGNDYVGVNLPDATKSGYDFDESANLYPTDNNNALINTDIMGPAFMFNLNRKSSLAVFTRARAFVTMHNVNGELIDNFDSDDSDDVNFSDGSLITTGHGWAELGVTYARVIINDRTKFLKGGLTVKYLQGGGSAHINGDNISVDLDADGDGPDDATISTTGDLTYAVFNDNIGEDGYEYELPKATGVGFDLGFVYEWRPDYPKYQKTNSNGDTYYVKDQNKYKLKLGLSITDIGSINYKEGVEQTYNIDQTDVNVDDLEDDFDNADSFKDFLDDFYGSTSPASNGYKVSLPTALHFNADWSFTNRLYVNLNTDLSLVSKEKVGATRVANTLSLTPRFESKWFSFYLPMGVVQYSGFQAGAGMRLGPLYVGSGSVLSALVSDNTKGADVYAGLKIPVYQGRAKDRDGDGVIDKLDACPKEAGPEENNGCPWGDADADGILDNVDECPNEVGPEENKGCPWGDTDNDGILDNEDACLNMAGPIENNGCPWGDADNDTVLDNVDQCPEVAGTVENNGCPAPAPKVTEAVMKSLNAYAKTILFNNGKSTLKDSSKAVLDNIVGILQEYPESNFSINGYTDSSGSDALNQRLSEERASTVMTYLIENGVSSSRLSHNGYGESNPIDDNATAEGRRNNRRVEVVLVKQ